MLSSTQFAPPRQTIFPDLSDFQYIQWPYLDCFTIPFHDLLVYSIQHLEIIFLAVSAHFCKLTIAYYFFLFKEYKMMYGPQFEPEYANLARRKQAYNHTNKR